MDARTLRVSAALLAAGLALLLALLLFAVTQPVAVRRAAPPEGADARRLRRDVEAIAALVPRNMAAPEVLDQAAALVRSRWEEDGIAVAGETFDVNGVTIENLVARFGPADGPRVVVGAHYDANGPYPGADDNASGVAGLLELGRLLKRHPPAERVDLAVLALEEAPFFGGPQMGSMVHAGALRREGAPVRAMLSLEMIGCFSDAPGSQGFPTPLLKAIYPTRGTFVTVAGRLRDARLTRRVKRAMAAATDLPVRSINGPPRFVGTDLSDNSSFWRNGYPAVMITDTAFYRNTRYHTAADTPETLDYARMAKVVTGVFAAVRGLARK